MRAFIARNLPTLETGLVRFDNWWDGRSSRERTLIGGLGLLLLLAILVFMIVKPLQASRAQSLADIRTYETLTARVRAAGTLRPAGGPAQRQGAPIEVANGAASGFGITGNAEPIPGGVRMTIADTTYDSLMGWIADLAGTSALRVRSLDVRRLPASGRVSATVELTQ